MKKEQILALVDVEPDIIDNIVAYYIDENENEENLSYDEQIQGAVELTCANPYTSVLYKFWPYLLDGLTQELVDFSKQIGMYGSLIVYIDGVYNDFSFYCDIINEYDFKECKREQENIKLMMQIEVSGTLKNKYLYKLEKLVKERLEQIAEQKKELARIEEEKKRLAEKERIRQEQELEKKRLAEEKFANYMETIRDYQEAHANDYETKFAQIFRKRFLAVAGCVKKRPNEDYKKYPAYSEYIVDKYICQIEDNDVEKQLKGTDVLGQKILFISRYKKFILTDYYLIINGYPYPLSELYEVLRIEGRKESRYGYDYGYVYIGKNMKRLLYVEEFFGEACTTTILINAVLKSINKKDLFGFRSSYGQARFYLCEKHGLIPPTNTKKKSFIKASWIVCKSCGEKLKWEEDYRTGFGLYDECNIDDVRKVLDKDKEGEEFIHRYLIAKPENSIKKTSVEPSQNTTEEQQFFCTMCGQKISKEDSFCAFCGAKNIYKGGL